MKVVDIITHRDEYTRESIAWAVAYDDGSCQWFNSLEEAQSFYESEED